MLRSACANLLIRSTAHSQGDGHLQIRITNTIDVSTGVRPAGDEKWTHIVTVSSSKQLSPGLVSLRPDRYTLLQFSNVACKDVLRMLDGRIGKADIVPHIEQLSDGSWEMVVPRSCCHMLRDMLHEVFAGSDVNLNYDPLEPLAACVELLGYSTARKLSKRLFMQRAERIISDGSPAAAYFAYRLSIMDTRDDPSDDASNDTKTILDEVLKAKGIAAISRRSGIWMFKIQFYDSTLSPECYNGLQICGLPASAFAASCIGTEGYNYYVEWKSQWQDDIPNELQPDLIDTLLYKLATIASPADTLLWHAESSTCTINGNGPTYHLCTGQDCFDCEHTTRNLSNELHFEEDDNGKSKWKKAVEFLANVLQVSQEQHSDNQQEMAEAILDLAYYKNPFSQLFLAEDDGPSQDTDLQGSTQSCYR